MKAKIIFLFLAFIILASGIYAAESIIYNFDDVRVGYAAEFEATLVGNLTGTWIDEIAGSSGRINVTYGVVELITDGVGSFNEEFIKISGSGGSKRFLLNSGMWDYYPDKGYRKIRSFFWSAKKLEDNIVVKDFTEPIYSVTLIRNYNGNGEITSFDLVFYEGGESSTEFLNDDETVQYSSNPSTVVEAGDDEANVNNIPESHETETRENERKNTPPVEMCNDTDNGKDYYVKGQVNGPCCTLPECGVCRYPSIDICRDDNFTLVENYCTNAVSGWLGQEVVNCTSGCRDGACVR